MKLDVGDVAGNENEVDGDFAGDLVGDVDVTALRVVDLGDFHGEQSATRPSPAQRSVTRVSGPAVRRAPRGQFRNSRAASGSKLARRWSGSTSWPEERSNAVFFCAGGASDV